MTLGDELITLAHCDLAGLVRGRSVLSSTFDARLAAGVGWVPANQAICCFGPLAEPNPWGSVGDRRLRPDPATRVRVDLWEDATPLEFVLCDAVHTDGSDWDACPRTLLRQALADLEAEAGLRVVASFEHEFVLLDERPSEQPFTIAAQRAVEPFGPLVMAALRQAGCEPELFLPEYGAHQFELPVAPVEGIAAADRAATLKEVVREVARRLGRRATFAPMVDPDGSASGVHVHLSLLDDRGDAVCYDPSRPGGVAAVAGSFAAGILRHLPALLALTAPSAISYLRLQPHHWSVGAACLGLCNREAAVRVAPSVTLGGGDPARQFNLEFRGADATACPHVVLAALVRAGLEGIRAGLATPPLLDRDPATLAPAELAAFGHRSLPTSLPEALVALDADPVARGWLSDDLYACYRSVKAAELAWVAELEPAATCRAYARVH